MPPPGGPPARPQGRRGRGEQPPAGLRPEELARAIEERTGVAYSKGHIYSLLGSLGLAKVERRAQGEPRRAQGEPAEAERGGGRGGKASAPARRRRGGQGGGGGGTPAA